MAGICKPSCATVLPNFGAIDDCDIEKALTSGEIVNLVLIKCNETFTDVTDDTEWTTKITANALTSLPVGNGKIDEVAESNEKRFNGVTVSLIKKKPFEFTSYIADTTAETEWTKYNQVLAQRLGLSIAFVTLDGILLIDPDWVTTKTIGLKLSTLKISQVLNGEADDKMFYKVSGEIAEGRSLKRVKLPADVLNVINA
ncbi:MAG TPA: hypothetical protein PKX89_11110 [Chitinophagales bacterium]|nr:hypothetical protein [Chitinophagales bacterium]HNC64948.1 hypothetical protein [Chitinophagales bacterium]HNF19913.1 hypothetical protein [Chitinophagales bacterium]